MKRLFIVNHKYYEPVDVGMDVTHAVAHVPYSYAFLCPVCGEVWARSPVVDGPLPSRWHALQRACQSHAEGVQIPGSVWTSWDRHFLASFPEELVRDEFLLHLTHWKSVREIPVCYG